MIILVYTWLWIKCDMFTKLFYQQNMPCYLLWRNTDLCIMTFNVNCRSAEEGILFKEIWLELSFFLNLFLFLSDYVILQNRTYMQILKKMSQNQEFLWHMACTNLWKNGRVSWNIPQIISRPSCLCVHLWGDCALRGKDTLIYIVGSC